jgi:hypothetical protein
VSKGLRYTFLFHAVIMFLLGLGMLFFTRQMTGIPAGETYDPTVARFTGTSLLAISLGSFLCFHAAEALEVRIYAAVQIAMGALGVLVGLYAVLFAEAGSFVWGNIGAFVVFTILFTAFYPRAQGVKSPAAAHLSAQA